ncbi:MAG: bacillithiol biosynthesis BshC [Planctomycetota bacterium]|nr:bacillithiol biosynthesis BshC [Planctomycetota bacterium]
MAGRFAFLPADLFPPLTPLARAALAGECALPEMRLLRSTADLGGVADVWGEDLRAELSSALLGPLAALEPHVAVLEGARALARPGTFCVVTSARPGLFAGPLASLWKALATVRLARRFSEHLGAPVLPILFNRADECTLAPALLLNRQLALQQVGLTSMGEERIALGAQRIDEELHRTGALRSALLQLHGDEPHLKQALELLMPRPGESPARAFTRSLLALAGPLGLVVVEPDWIRSQLAAALVRIVGGVSPDALAEGARAVADLDPAAGVEAQSALVHFGVGGPRELRAGGEGYRFEGEPGSRSGAELAALIVGEPAAWVGGPRLEHLLLDLVLPSVCELGGPRSLALRAAAGPLRRALALEPGAFVLRGPVSVVDDACARSLEARSRDVADVLGGAAELTATSEPEPPVFGRLRAIAADAGASLRGLRPELAEIDRGLGARLRRTAGQVEELVEGFAERAARAQRQRAGTRGRHLRRLWAALTPEGQPQEALLGPFSLVARHGLDWLEPLALALDSLSAEHLVVQLDPPGPHELPG